jgi:hypothetical protein
MPLYGVPQSGPNATNSGLNLTSLAPGDGPFYLFNAETLTAPQASVAFARATAFGGADNGTTFNIRFAAAPTAVVVIEAANVDVDANYVSVFTLTDTQIGAYTDIGRSCFYRARLVSQSGGGALTVTAQR